MHKILYPSCRNLYSTQSTWKQTSLRLPGFPPRGRGGWRLQASERRLLLWAYGRETGLHNPPATGCARVPEIAWGEPGRHRASGDRYRRRSTFPKPDPDPYTATPRGPWKHDFPADTPQLMTRMLCGSARRCHLSPAVLAALDAVVALCSRQPRPPARYIPRGVGCRAGSKDHRVEFWDGVYHLLWAAFPNNPTPRRETAAGDVEAWHPARERPRSRNSVSSHRPKLVPNTTGPAGRGRGIRCRADPSPLAVTGGILVSFFSSA